jgi:hypothetical protein
VSWLSTRQHARLRRFCSGTRERDLAIQPVGRRHAVVAPDSVSATFERNGAPPCSIRGTASSSTSASLETMYPVPSVWRTSFLAVGHRSSRTSSSSRHPTVASRCRSTVTSFSRRSRSDGTPRLVRLPIWCADASAPRSPADAGELARIPSVRAVRPSRQPTDARFTPPSVSRTATRTLQSAATEDAGGSAELAATSPRARPTPTSKR